MNTFVVYNEDGTIQSCADWKFPNSVEVAFEVVRGWDGRLYNAGEEPPRPVETVFESLRASRDARLAATDMYMLADYPISEDNRALVKGYRAALRDLPDQPGAPWDGGGDQTPWPELPSVG